MVTVWCIYEFARETQKMAHTTAQTRKIER